MTKGFAWRYRTSIAERDWSGFRLLLLADGFFFGVIFVVAVLWTLAETAFK